MEKTYLCVYGTLMRGIHSSKTKLLGRYGRFAGETEIPGRLYDLGSYPGLVYDPEAEKQVRGHVFELTEPERVLPILDEYEGVDPKRPEAGPYLRIRVDLPVAGEGRPCWLYPYIWPTDGFARIESGDYLAYLPTRPEHLKFIRSA